MMLAGTLLMLALSQTPTPPAPPTVVATQCSIDRPKERPDVWDLSTIIEYSDGHKTRTFLAEYHSLDKAMKACQKWMESMHQKPSKANATRRHQ